jgi:hypothetical protein
MTKLVLGRLIYLFISSFTACFSVPYFSNNVNKHCAKLYLIPQIFTKLFKENLPVTSAKSLPPYIFKVAHLRHQGLGIDTLSGRSAHTPLICLVKYETDLRFALNA